MHKLYSLLSEYWLNEANISLLQAKYGSLDNLITAPQKYDPNVITAVYNLLSNKEAIVAALNDVKSSLPKDRTINLPVYKILKDTCKLGEYVSP